MLQDAIRQLVKLFDPEGVELGCTSTTLRLLPAGASAPWREPESYYFGFVERPACLHSHNIMTKTINRSIDGNAYGFSFFLQIYTPQCVGTFVAVLTYILLNFIQV